jgi:uncharacterized protein
MLDNVPNGSRIFIDSNIFIYHFLNLSDSCTALLVKAEKRDITACTSTVVLAEVLHRLTIAETAENYGIRPGQAVKFLKKNPEAVKSLEKSEDAVAEIPGFNIGILPLGRDGIFESRVMRETYCLLTNDSLNLHIMKANRIRDIATNDSDFEQVDWITVWKPSWVRS